jgi:hypothetical protein
MNVSLPLTAVNIARKKCILFSVYLYIQRIEKIKFKGMFEIKTSRCVQLSSGVSEDVWNSDFSFMENVILS